MDKIIQRVSQFIRSSIFVNSSWGLVSQGLQTILLSLFFVIIARSYSTTLFADYIVATVLYQLLSAFSSLGLSQWFVREITGSLDKTTLINRFFKIQLYSGLAFYVLNIIIASLFYHNLVTTLSIYLGVNIVFDNIINAIKCINISEHNQKKSFVILAIDATLKFLTACILFVYPLSITTISILLIVIRFLTLNLFLSIGSSKEISLWKILRYPVSFALVRDLISMNWSFIIIGGISIVNWRISALIISKTLSAIDIAHYEISYKVFSIAQLLVVAVSTSVFPVLISYYKEGKTKELIAIYKKLNLYYFVGALAVFTFVFSFSHFFLPFIFGSEYEDSSIYTNQMFLTILIFPSAFLQANLLVAMQLEKLDMWFNVANFAINLTFTTLGLYYIDSLTVVNISIFISLVAFHILQSIALVKRQITTRTDVLTMYLFGGAIVVSYIALSEFFNPVVLYAGYWAILIAAGYAFFRNRIRSKSTLLQHDDLSETQKIGSNPPQKTKKKITWVTPDYFVDCDMNPELLSRILEHFEINWIVLLPKHGARYSEGDFKEISKLRGMTIDFEYWEYRARNPMMLFFFKRVYRKIKKTRSNIIYFNYPITSPFELPLFWRLEKDKTIFSAHDGNVKGSFRMAALSKMVYNLAYSRTRFINTFSESESSSFTSRFKNAKTFRIPLGPKDFGDFSGAKRTDNVVFLFFGAIHSNKNVDLLIDAACEMYKNGTRGFKVAIHGVCSEWDRYSKKISYPELFECDIRLHKNSEIPELFGQSHYLVLPYKEMSQSGTLKVAYRYLLPVVASNLKAFVDEVHHGINGFLFEAGNSEDLIRVLTEILSLHTSRYTSLQQRIAKYTEENYSVEILANQYTAMFHQVLDFKKNQVR